METEELHNTIEELSHNLACNIYQTIGILASIVAMNEKHYVGSHSKYVAGKSAQIARTLGLNDDEVFEIETAALLHDLGKLRFSDHLSSLTINEMNDKQYGQYLMHPELASRLLDNHHAFKDISLIIGQHHEKPDGSGFPKNLGRAAIHPGASIISVVDTFHNMVFKQKRENNNGKPPIMFSSASAYFESTESRFNGAMNYLHGKSGTLFEKKVVAIFTDMILTERRNMGTMTVVRVPVNMIKPGMIFAEDYYTSYGLLIAARGEELRQEMVRSLVRFAENGEMPQKILVLK